jgi:transcriptional regulator with XRE-family HTH domain
MSMTLRQARERKCWGQAELARRVGISPNTLYRIEAGRCRARPGTLRRLAEALGVEPSDLVENEAARREAVLAALDAAVAFSQRLAAQGRTFSPSTAELIAESRAERSEQL